VTDRSIERRRAQEQSIPHVSNRCVERFSGGTAKYILALAASITVSGCGVGNLTSSLGTGGIFGSSKRDSGWTASVTEASMLHAAKTEGGPVDLANPEQEGCPPFASSHPQRYVTVYESGHSGDALSVMYRGEVTKTSRECEINSNGVTLKYGFAGRVLLGPKGKPGVVTLPVIFAVMDPAHNKIKTEALKLQVEVSSDKPVGYYSVVRVISFRTAPGTPASAYTISVVFKQKS
jgi:hypothetical protein